MNTPPLTHAIIGHTGFVGGNLARQHHFDDCFNSATIDTIAGRHFDLLVCAGARAEKWKAQADPEGDRRGIERLLHALEQVRATRLVLISTVDVFGRPIEVDESSPVETTGLHPYGAHRYMLEQAVAARFETVILRLPGLYGLGLKKNVIYDFMHRHDTHKIDSRGVFQFYGLDRLWADVEIALAHRLPLVHLATEPVSVHDVVRRAFGLDFDNHVADTPARYDMRTKFALAFGGDGSYIENQERVLAGIAKFADAG